jgi:hypothetical protein
MKINTFMNECSGFEWLRIDPSDRLLTTLVKKTIAMELPDHLHKSKF